ncbi:MAG: nadD [Alphaproteobacteria bacterium]|nr:nadD [Alphaproteobacteria bacterium]
MPGAKTNRIGLWGGSFNPPTLAHKKLADFAFAALALDEMHWIVTPQNPEKDPATLAPFEHRFQMVSEVIADNPGMKADDVEQKLGSSHTINTVRALRREYPDDHLYFLMGADNWMGFHNWGKDYAEILDYVSIAVMYRPGYKRLEEAQATAIFADIIVRTPQDLQAKKTICFIENPMIDMAATQVRQALARGETPNQISAQTLNYIRYHRLYGMAS